MDFPIFRSQRAKPSASVSNFYGSAARGFPVQPEATTTAAAPAAARTPKVVQIPVHFVGSGSAPNRSKAAASKIQKVFRGFLVRKSMKKIIAIKKEVDEIEARISREEEAELIKKDAKERLKVNEMLMALLFKLDSIRGVDSGVRDCRKAVIKKAIALQERVDALSSSSSSSSGNDRIELETETIAEEKDHHEAKDDDDDEVVRDFGAGNPVEGCNSDVQDSSAYNSVKSNTTVVDFENGSGRGSEEIDNGGEVDKVSEEPLIEKKCLQDVMNTEESGVQKCDNEDGRSDLGMNADEVEEGAGVDSGMKVDEEVCVDKLMLDNVENKNDRDDGVEVDSLMKDNGEETCAKTPAHSECVEDGDGHGAMVEAEENENDNVDEGRQVGRADDENNNINNNGNRELLEKMMEDNHKMIKLMTQLYERNEAQTRMLNTLTQRVEQLEKAFVCDKIKRNKKKRHSP